MAINATTFQPQLLIIAFYSGNDALESFKLAYGIKRFHDLRPDTALGPGDAPAVQFPSPPEDHWPVTFAGGTATIFTPALRLAANEPHPAVDAGYRIMENVAREIRRITKPFNVAIAFTIIPTKELVYAEKIRSQGITPPETYERLIAVERSRIENLASVLKAIPDVHYVDITASLQKAAVEDQALYPQSINGHPIAAGYKVIARTIAARAREWVTARPKGLLGILESQDPAGLFLARSDGVWRFPNWEVASRNGWSEDEVTFTSFRALAGLPRRGIINEVDPSRYGPRSVH